IQCQEAVKLLHGLPTLAGQGFVFDGTNHESYRVNYTRKEDCPSHEAFAPIEELPWQAGTTRAGDLLDKVRSDLGPTAVLEANQDLLAGLECPPCGTEEPLRTSLGKVTEAQGRCPRCGRPRAPRMYRQVDDKDRTLLDATLAELGIPPWDILGG